ncbi:hypothetical protein BCD67_08960 [Oscillatoriales cyanobacterium USR001]|nr:hypothetical protein BCD67_08960 [Oscillatoriales cyanobacterium USR001]
MPELLRCIECGTPVTLDDRECPHCHTEYPQGVVCLGCFETLKQSAAVQHETHTTHSVKYFHPACYQKIVQPLSPSVRSANQSFDSRTQVNSYDQKTLDALIKADAKRAQKEEERKRVERRAKVISRTLRFFFLGIIGFIFWGGILSLMFGEVGIIIGFIVAVLLTVEIMKEM